MNNRVTSEEVANQFAKAIQLLLDWYRQEIVNPSQFRSVSSPVEKEREITQTLPEADKLLKAGEVAELLQLSHSKAYNLMQRGEIPTVRMGRTVRVRRSDLEEFIEKNKAEGGM
jgi:excisionase family DNA binding protein